MTLGAPLHVTVEVLLESGPRSGAKVYRLSHRLELPPSLHFHRELPLEGDGRGRIRFCWPGGPEVNARSLLFFDPEHAEQGSRAELQDLEPTVLQALQAYLEERELRTAR